MINKHPSCTDIFESGLIPADRALANILSRITPIADYECISIENARGRTLFEPVIAPFNVPIHNNSAVDGYAIHSSDIPAQGSKKLSISGKAFAGDSRAGHLQPNQCIRIMTGAAIPAGVDTVLMQEHVEIHENFIVIDQQLRSGENIRMAGEDLQQGETILQPGKYLTAPDIGLLASIGIAEIKVKRKLRVAIASTGNEVFAIGDQPTYGGIYDSNRYSLQAAMDRPDIEIINLGILEDNPDTLLQQFNEAGEYADMIISSGGVSVGDADHTKTALQTSGRIDFWKLAIKPGRPMAFGHLGKSVFFGLPGNPVAVMVTFYQFVLPALDKMLGMTDKPIAPTFAVKSTENIRKKPGRTEIVRAVLQQVSSGEWSVKTTGKQGSGILRSMSLANSFIILEHDRTNIKSGDLVTVQPFAGLM
jgi:molybdopterin molybdotransferase